MNEKYGMTRVVQIVILESRKINHAFVILEPADRESV
ncbi:hypothetical protein SAMN05216325_11959 [Nitrosomonas marina]|uniref:Uncharacterized protein n=1 Tax=Nitrosomonas marina TaxID=917 RepID=A0A1H8GUR7_9PROT|nr:hypothetical protein SAMN05216325_11959 [Nitrosomonas marina]